MKLNKLFAFAAAALAIATACTKENVNQFSEVQVSSSYVALPADGGSTTITVTAQDSWKISDAPSWLTVTPSEGAAGNTSVTFKSEKAKATQECTVLLSCLNRTQRINVIQMTEKVELPVTKVADVIKAGAGTFRLKGVASGVKRGNVDKYGNWYLTDDTGTIYIYGTLDKSGSEKNYPTDSWDFEDGDELTIEGPYSLYGSTHEIVNATVISISKSLIKCDSLKVNDELNGILPIEGGEAVAYLNCKGDGVSVSVPEDAQSWLSVTGIETGSSAKVTFHASKNDAGDRSTTLTFITTKSGKSYSSQATLNQKGSILEITAAEFATKEKGDALYKITGIVSKIAKDDQTKLYTNYYIKDATGEVYVYGSYDENGNKISAVSKYGLKVGDIVTVVGKKDVYNGTDELVNAYFEKYTSVATVSIKEFREKADNKEVYYLISGTVGKSEEANTKYDLAAYGNYALTDETGTVYVYGTTNGWGGEKGKFGELGVKEGDKLTIVAYKTSYKGLIEAVGYYLKHEEAKPDTPVEPSSDPFATNLTVALGANAYNDGVATVNEKANITTVKIGTSSKAGDFTITVPAGSKKVSFYAVAWKGTTEATVPCTAGSTTVATMTVKGNDGATGNSPYTLTVTDAERFTINQTFAAATDIKITCPKRVIFFGIQAE